MANAKQYSDLEQAQTVNNTDQFAVAQEGADELKTVTTEQVAERVAGIVSTDQLQEFISDTALGKQVLAQSLANKGVETSATDTLAQMAAKIDPVDVVGAQEYLYAKRHLLSNYQLEISSPDTTGYTAALNYKDLILTVNCTTKTITTRRLVGSDTGWTVLDTKTDADILGTVFMITPNKDQSSVAIVTYTSSSAVNLMVYDVADDGTLAKVGNTIVTPYTSLSSSYNYSGLYLSPSGRIAYFQAYSSNTGAYTLYKYNIEDGTQETLTLNAYIANGSYFTMPDEKTIVAVYTGSSGNKIFVGEIVGDQISVSEISIGGGSYGQYCVLPLAKDDLIVQWYPKDYTTYGGEVRVLTVHSLKTGNLIKQMETVHLKLNTTNTSSLSYYAYTSALCFRFEDGVYTIFDAFCGSAKYTVATETLELENGTTATIAGRPLSSLFLLDTRNTNYNGVSGNPSSTYISADGRLFTGNRGSLSRSAVQWTSPFMCTFYQDTPVVGLAYRRNGQETLFKGPYFNETEYAAGAYALKSTEAVLDITGEGE